MPLPREIPIAAEENSLFSDAVPKKTPKVNAGNVRIFQRQQELLHCQKSPKVALKRKIEKDSLLNLEGKPSKRSRYTSSFPKIFKPTDEIFSPFGEIASNLTSEHIEANLGKEIESIRKQQVLYFHDDDISDNSPSFLMSSTGCDRTTRFSVDEPLVSFGEIGLICERMLKEREKEVRIEYDRILNDKLAEQHEMFKKFTFENIQKRYDGSSIPNYFS